MHIINEHYCTISREKFDQLKLTCDNNECTYLCEELSNLSKVKCEPCTSLNAIVYEGINICNEDNIKDRLNYCTDNHYLYYDYSKDNLLLQTTNYGNKLLNFINTFLSFTSISIISILPFILCKFYYEIKLYSIEQEKLEIEEQIVRNNQKYNSKLAELEQEKSEAEQEAKYSYNLYYCKLDELNAEKVKLKQQLLVLNVLANDIHKLSQDSEESDDNI